MDKRKVFSVLGIDITKDVAGIKNAYRAKLVQVNPEDDPEGFKQLREAYEEAIRLANLEGNDDEETASKTPIEQWIDEVQQAYEKLSTRRNLELWKKLFKYDVCIDFDTENEAREAFLEFLMDHFRLPFEVWKLIEDTFQLADIREELYEKFPRDFVDFVTEDIESKGWFEFELFEGDDEIDPDELIAKYLSLRGMNDTSNYDGAEEVFEKLMQAELRHPYFEAELIRFLKQNGRVDQAMILAEKLLAKSTESLYAQYHIAELLMENNEIERANAICNGILEKNPEHFGARILICDYHLKKCDYQAAKDGYIELMEFDAYNDRLQQGMLHANVGLMEQYKEQLQREPDNHAVRLELAWCFYQNSQHEECGKVAGEVQLNDEIRYDYYNLMSRNCIELQDYDKGCACAEKWLEEILGTEKDGSEKAVVRYNRLGLAYFLLSKYHYQFSKEKENKNDHYKQYQEYIELAIGAEQNIASKLSYLFTKAQALLEVDENKLCIDVCDEIINIEKGYYVAYVIRQKAYFNLAMAQEVIDDYNSAVEIFAADASPYIYAIKVYQIYEQCDDADEVFTRAKEAGVQSNELLFLELKNRRMMAAENDIRGDVAEELGKLYKQAKNEQGGLEDTSELLYEQALCYYDMDEYKQALEVIEEKLKINSNAGSIRLKADILYYMEEYQQCINTYADLLKEDKEYTRGYFISGLSWRALGNEENALESFQRVVELEPEHQYVYDVMSDIYKRRYMEQYHIEDYELSVKYGKLQVENNPNCHYLNNLGLVYLEGYDIRVAIKEFEEALKYDESDLYVYNNIGYAYKVLGEFEKVHQYYEKSIELGKGEVLLPYWNLAVYYRSTGQFEKAIETYQQILKIDEDALSARNLIFEVHKQMGYWDKAIAQAKWNFENGADEKIDYYINSAEVCLYAGRTKEALQYLKQARRKIFLSHNPYESIGDYYLWVARDKKKALVYYKIAFWFSKKKDNDAAKKSLNRVLAAYCEMGKQKIAEKYLKRSEQGHHKWYSDMQSKLANPEYRKVNLYHLAALNINIGHYDKAQQYMQQMEDSLNCTHCTYCECYEYIELQGRMLEMEKDYHGALEKYKRALDIAPDNLHLICWIKELSEKIGER